MTRRVSNFIIRGEMKSPCLSHRQSLQASRGKAADYNGSSSEDEEEEWSPKFVQEAKSKFEQETSGSSTPTLEEPFLVEKAKEKFWGRIAVISLGVKLSCCSWQQSKGVVTNSLSVACL